MLVSDLRQVSSNLSLEMHGAERFLNPIVINA